MTGVTNVKIEGLKKSGALIVAGVIGLLLLIVPGFLPSGEKSSANAIDAENTEYYSEHLEKRLAELISKVSGAGDASVIVTLDGGSEYVYAANTKTSEQGSAVDYIVINSGDGEGGLALGKIYPRVRGVAVVCYGGSSPTVKNEITQLIAAALGISTSRIMVCGQE